MVRYVGKATADRVAGGIDRKPWYTNWKVLVPIGLGASLLVGLGIYAMRKKRRRR